MPVSAAVLIDQLRSHTLLIFLAIKQQFEEDVNVLLKGSDDIPANFVDEQDDHNSCMGNNSHNSNYAVVRSAAYLRILTIMIPLCWLLILFLRRIRIELNDDIVAHLSQAAQAQAQEEEMPYEHYAMNFEKFYNSQIRYSRQPYRKLVLNPNNKLVLNMNNKKRSGVIYGFNLLVLLKDLFAFLACSWRKQPKNNNEDADTATNTCSNNSNGYNGSTGQGSSSSENNNKHEQKKLAQLEMKYDEAGTYNNNVLSNDGRDGNVVVGKEQCLYMEAPKSNRIHHTSTTTKQQQQQQLEQEQEQIQQNSPLHLNHLKQLYTKPETSIENLNSNSNSGRTITTTIEQSSSNNNNNNPETFVQAALKKERSNTASQFYFDSVEHETHLYSVQHNNRIVYQYQFDHDLPASQDDNNGHGHGQQTCTPLLVFINTGSGPQQGSVLLGQLRRILNPIQVFDLNNISASPESILTCFLSRFQRSLRILVCGGDGTVAWIIGALDKCKTNFMADEDNNKTSLADIDVPIAILPLGTGNDLARILGWGGGFGSSSRNDTLIEILNRAATAEPVFLDRWTVSVNNDNDNNNSSNINSNNNSNNSKGKSTTRKQQQHGFTNYVGVGCDAAAALQIHMLRQSRPSLFSVHRLLNQFFYALMGSREVIDKSYKMADMCELICDGEPVPLPPDCQGIVCLNIDCYAGGIPVWDRALMEHRYACDRNQHRYGSFVLDGPVRDDSIYNSTLTWPKLTSLSAANLLNAATTTANGNNMHQNQNHDNDKFQASSYNDALIDVCYVRGTFHLGQIKVGVSNAKLLAQARSVEIKIKKNKVQMPIQWDGEPQLLSPGPHTLEITHDGKTKQSCMLKARRVTTNLAQHTSALDCNDCESVLLWARDTGVIDDSAYEKIIDEMNHRYSAGKKGKLIGETGDELSSSEKEGIRMRSLSFT